MHWITEIKWISVKESLPVIPKGSYAVKVLIAEFDPCYEELCPGKGTDVHACMYGEIVKNEFFHKWRKKKDFMQLYYGGRHPDWGPIIDQVLYWAYLPAPPPDTKGKKQRTERRRK